MTFQFRPPPPNCATSTDHGDFVTSSWRHCIQSLNNDHTLTLNESIPKETSHHNFGGIICNDDEKAEEHADKLTHDKTAIVKDANEGKRGSHRYASIMERLDYCNYNCSTREQRNSTFDSSAGSPDCPTMVDFHRKDDQDLSAINMQTYDDGILLHSNGRNEYAGATSSYDNEEKQRMIVGETQRQTKETI